MRAVILLAVLACPAWADAPETSLRPLPRDPGEPVTVSTKSPAYVQEERRPAPADLPLFLTDDAGVAPLLPRLPEHVARPEVEAKDAPLGPTLALAAVIPPPDALRPRPRDGEERVGLQPRPRPEGLERPVNPASRVEVVQVSSTAAVLRSPRPTARPDNIQRRAVVAAARMVPIQPQPPVQGSQRGALCGDRSIRGEAIAAIPARVSGCGLTEGVRVTEVDGVRLSTPANIDCVTAQALRRWVTESVKPNVGRLGGGVAGLNVMASYSCRTRNNQPGAKVSEHGRGRAIDIGGIILKNGATISVLNGWRDPQHGDILRRLHRGACGVFGTVLGPASDRFHQNHFHLDTARYRSGSYCR